MSQIIREAEGIENREPMPILEAGDHLDQATFHARYKAMPEGVKAELIEGVVYMSAALARRHGRSHSQIMLWLTTYEASTPGVETYDNTTAIMGKDSEPQPDACLIVRPDRGGQMSFTEEDFLRGAPELIAEIASSTESYDLHSKKRDYEKAGVREYVVVALRQEQVFWFVHERGRFVEQRPDDGIYRSTTFPGLWLDSQALLDLEAKRLLHVLEQGTSTPEHQAFADRLKSD